MVIQDAEFWRGKRVLITGHTGFKGAWLTFILERLGAEICGISKKDSGSHSFYETTEVSKRIHSIDLDIRDNFGANQAVKNFDPEIVFHLAAQSLVLDGYEDPYRTFSTNFSGTLNIIESVKLSKACKVAIMATTDKVYENKGDGLAYKETDRIGGDDPYSASKAACEHLINGYAKSFFKTRDIGIAAVRAGNVIGGGDFNESRLLPDINRAWLSNSPLEVRSPDSTRPWQHVLEPLTGYLRLAVKLYENSNYSGGYNFGPTHGGVISVREIVKIASKHLDNFGYIIQKDKEYKREAILLNLDATKAFRVLKHQSLLSVDQSVERTLGWYKQFAAGIPAETLCAEDLDFYGILNETK